MRAAIYTRISEDDAEGDARGQGVARQEKDARAEADRRGWEVVGVYQDNDVSATRSKSRPAYERLLRDVRAGMVQAVIVWDIDRLTRTPREVEDFIELADATGLTLVNVTGAGDVGSDDGRLMLRIKGAMARREIEQMRKRLKRKYRENALEGKPHGRAPYGMMRVGGRDVPDPETAPVLQELAERTLAGESLRGIAKDLTARGVAGPGSPSWNSTIIRQALLRPSYAGLRQYDGKVVGRTNGEPVFDRDTHERLVALLTDPSRKQNHRGSQPLYLLSGVAHCGRCGGKMRSQTGHVTVSKKTGAQKRQPAAYVCASCFKVRRQRGPVDAVVEAVVLEWLNDERIIERLFVKGDPKAAREAQDRIVALDAKLALVADQFAADEITPDQMRRITAKLRDDRRTAEARLRASAPNDRLERFVGGDVERVWKAATTPERREVIDTLFDVTIDPQGPGRRFDPDLIRVGLKRA